MPRMKIVPAYEDPHNSVDLIDADRQNQWGGPFCVAPAILYEQAHEYWEEYLRSLHVDSTLKVNQ